MKHGYDRAGNRLYREDPVARANGADMDEAYTYDGLYQLKTFVRGALNAQKTAVAAPTFRQAWDFDTTGNWTRFREDKDGDGKWDLHQTRQHNAVNEITAIDASVGDIWISPTHDHNGNTLRIPQPNDPAKQFTLKWDAWNRLVKVSDVESVIAEYQYDPRNFRVLKRLHVDPDRLPTIHDPLSTPIVRHFYYNSRWQSLEERLEGDGGLPVNADRQFVWGLRYIDDLILRDRDTSEPVDGILDERLCALQDANWNVVALRSTDGRICERSACAAYGKASFRTPELGERTSSAHAWDNLYTGRGVEPVINLHDYRARPYVSWLGRFVARDPVGYSAGDPNVYRYVRNSPLAAADPSGTIHFPPSPEIQAFIKQHGLVLPNAVESACMQLARKYLAGGYDCDDIRVCRKLPSGKDGVTYVALFCPRVSCISSTWAGLCQSGQCTHFMQLMGSMAHECYHIRAIAILQSEKKADAAVHLTMQVMKSRCRQLAGEPNSPCPTEKQCLEAIQSYEEHYAHGD